MIEVHKLNLLDKGIILFYGKDWEKQATNWSTKTGKAVTNYYVQKHPVGCIICSYKLEKEDND